MTTPFTGQDLEQWALENYQMPVLVVTVGLPRSGKSTWAMQQGVPVVNPDAIRKALGVYPFKKEAEPMVWNIARYMVVSLFKAGHRCVILDATTISKRRRTEWRNQDWTCVFKVFETAATTCKERAKRDGQNYLVDLGVIDRMQREFEPVASSEGDLL